MSFAKSLRGARCLWSCMNRDRSGLLLPTSPAFLRLQAQRCGGTGGLVFRRHAIAFGTLGDEVEALATWLAKHGVGGGDHVALVAANGPALVAALYAVWGVGAVAVPFGPPIRTSWRAC